MSRKTEEREINGLKVTTIQLPATRGSALRFKLARVLAPVAGTLRTKTAADLLSLNVADLAPTLMALAAQLDPAVMDALMLEILACTSVITTDAAGRQIKFDLTSKQIIDQAFDGDVDALWSTMRFAVEVNLSGFFAALAGNTQPAPTPSS